MPEINSMKKGSRANILAGRASISPQAPALAAESARAARFGDQPSSFTIARMRFLVSSETPGRSFRASETAPFDTPARFAMSLIVPGSEGERFLWEVRWPGVLQAELGSEYRVIEEGLSGRTTVLDNPLEPYRNGREYLLPCLQSHQPLDLVVIFLGTNDLGDRYTLPPLDIARGAAQLALLAQRSETGPGYGAPATLLCSLPQIGDTSSIVDTFSGAVAKAADLLRCFRIAADEVGAPLVDLAAV